MNLDELQSVQSRERQASSLQHLRDSFYQEAGEFVRELHDRRDQAAAESDDPFGSEEVRRLSDDLDTAERTVEAIYERRVGKVVKMASIAAADMPYDDDGLTDEEARLFETLVERIRENRELVLSVLDGETPGLTCDRPEPGAETGTGAEAVDDGPSAGGVGSTAPGPGEAEAGTEPALGGDTGREPTNETRPSTAAEASTEDDEPSAFDIGDAMGGGREGSVGGEAEPTEAEPTEAEPERADPPAAGAGAGGKSTAQESGPDADGPERVARTTVRITADVGDIFGVDGRAYDLSPEDVVTLPEENATILTNQGQAERLE
jgi:DNA replication factor GINS